MTKKIDVGIIGSGNIGSDLMMKLLRNDLLNPTYMIGIDAESRGMKMAAENGLTTISTGIDGLKDVENKPKMLFDATSAKAHEYNNQVAQELGIQMFDLTPAAIGPFTSPTVNINDHLDKTNVNLITCGGQATTPLVAAINDVASVKYAEIVATISSASAGPGTRANIDEFTETTSKALEEVGGADKGKAIIILNPAEPPILMRDTIYAIVEEDQLDEEKIVKAIREREKEIQAIVPGYRLRTDPIFDDNQITLFVEVEGAGDYLPVYSGNLDIMTASAVGLAEAFAKKMNQEATGGA
ncbi:acetaldehyde dehydrogenase (acetylating) [Ruoffia tabacinasalis]|uniref:Acetaldehyde dehydrogenase n=1 Tax=Ruoffia tabacinasalis TaxID=87458 RepID=A0A5R9DY82_9LACT|nr:acetaldehyde dehydrogenase (acetylating) [Ruoffia tabacinasalis]TLQ41723.1 acetaldehyde dehydrogenase (acetylating) [Ruoffia tabacinasalis]